MFKTIEDLPIEEGTKVLIRVDFNTPLKGNAEKKVADATRIKAALPTIDYCLKKNAAVILCSHLGRPKGQINKELSLMPVAETLAELLSKDVMLSEEVVGDGSRKLVQDLREGQILLLENLRFKPEEKSNDASFAEELAGYCDVYINDAFGAAHRAHASTAGITKFAKESGAGLLIKQEIEALTKLAKSPSKPYMAIVGGAKVSDKIEVLDALLKRVDTMAIGGAMANTFLLSQGRQMGKSLVEEDKLELARRFLREAAHNNVKILLPVDVNVATSFDATESQTRGVGEMDSEEMALDIGPVSVRRFSEEIRKSKTIFWNGPMGVFEKTVFAEGTFALAKAIAQNSSAYSVVGGGDSVAAIHKAGLADQVSHISTGGGASLQFIQGLPLPALDALGYSK